MKLAEVFLFAGTSEGRAIARRLKEKKIPSIVFVATDYGKELIEASETLQVHAKRLDKASMKEWMTRHHPRIVLDATHPYALEVSREIVAACEECSIDYLRVERESSEEGERIFHSMEDMVHWLGTHDEVVFSTLGAKSLAALSEVKNYKERIWVRILPMMESLELSQQAGFPSAHLICMQGPFSKEVNLALFRASGASVLLTKDSGKTGGWREKIDAAKECGMTIAVLSRPKKQPGITLEELWERMASW